MRKPFIIFVFLLFVTCVFSQTKVDSLIEEGIQLHEKGEFENAIAMYNLALEIEPENSLAFYEIAYSYLQLKNYSKAIKFADKVIEQDGEHVLMSYVLKGNALDYIGKTQESIELFEKAIKKKGGHYLLYYNLGLNYYKTNNPIKTEEALINALMLKFNHASSHLLLSYLMFENKQKAKSLLCLHYFLFIEPNTERSKKAYSLIKEQFGSNVKRDENNPQSITITFDPDIEDKDFRAADLMISMLEVSKSIEKNEGKTEDELFIENTESFFKFMGELKKKKHKGLWWEYYVPFFDDIAKSGHIEAYCNYISQSSNENAVKWMEDNEKKLDEFGQWLQQ
ncbi:MAG: tetratricopeptide repeat protein [Bacteroidales bacterium]|nr:tetratricopeptide repeat protein [Bacteroidales bacterium]